MRLFVIPLRCVGLIEDEPLNIGVHVLRGLKEFLGDCCLVLLPPPEAMAASALDVPPFVVVALPSMSLSCRSLLPVAYFPLLPSLVDCCVLSQPLPCGCSSRPNSNTVTPAKLASDLGIQIVLWSENDATKTS
jgi:hypothetical protein